LANLGEKVLQLQCQLILLQKAADACLARWHRRATSAPTPLGAQNLPFPGAVYPPPSGQFL